MWELHFREEALADLDALDESIRRRVLKRLQWLAENFDDISPDALTGELAGLFKFKIGDYRAVYRPVSERRALIIHFIDHRRRVYKRK